MVVNLKADIQPTADSAQQVPLMDKINNYLLKFSRVPATEKLFFVQHLGVMLKAGMPLLNAMQTLAKQSSNKRFTKIITETAQAIEKGKSFTEALKMNDDVFDELFINMVEAGEMSGKLESVLDQIYLQMKKQHQLIAKIKGAMTYPTVILFAMSGIGIFMMVVVVPQITSMFKDLDADLPIATKILIGVSDFLAANTLLAGIIAAVFVFTIIKIIKTPKGKFYFHLMLIKLPVFGKIIKNHQLSVKDRHHDHQMLPDYRQRGWQRSLPSRYQ
jgi:type IV pilus assembly protein PilC